MNSVNISPLFESLHANRLAQNEAPRLLASKVREAVGVVIDSLSVLRNTVSAISYKISSHSPKISNKMGTFVGAGVIAGGTLGIAAGGNIVYKAVRKLRKDYKRSNVEAAKDHAGDALVGASYGGLSAGMVISQAGVFAKASLVAGVGTMMYTVGGFGMYGIIGLTAIRKIVKNFAFRTELRDALNANYYKPNSLVEGLRYLQAQVQGASEDDLQNKWDEFASFTDENCCRAVRESVQNGLLQKCEQGDLKALQKAALLIGEIKRANTKQLTRQYILSAIAGLGLVTMVAATFFATGPLVPILFAVGALLWLIIDSSKVQKKVLDFFHGKAGDLNQELFQSGKITASGSYFEEPELYWKRLAENACLPLRND